MEMHIKTECSAQDFYNQGNNFEEAAQRCFGKYEQGRFSIIKDGAFLQLPAPTVVNSAFACEMFLKSILTHFCVPFGKEHNLLKLYLKIPPEAQSVIHQICFHGREEREFQEMLRRHSMDFVEIRYFFEKTGWTSTSPICMLTLACNLNTAAEFILSHATGDITRGEK